MKYTIEDMEIADNVVDVNSSDDSEYDSELFLLLVLKFNSRFQRSL